MSPFLIVSLIWALSFPFIGHYLSGQVGVAEAIFCRLLMACGIFLIFLRRDNLKIRHALVMMGLGFLQIGLMYTFYYRSFLFLTVSQVALLTIITPLYLFIFAQIHAKKLCWRSLLLVLLSLGGSLLIVYQGQHPNKWIGVLLIQAANCCFAYGQWLFRSLRPRGIKLTKDQFFFFFLGALIPSSIELIFSSSRNWPTTIIQWGVIVWLGTIASAVGIYVWNRQSTNANPTSLAVANNLVIPLAVLVNWIFWGRDVEFKTFIPGSLLIFVSFFYPSTVQSLQRKGEFVPS